MLDEQYNLNRLTLTEKDFDILCDELRKTTRRLYQYAPYPNEVECFILMSREFKDSFLRYCYNHLLIHSYSKGLENDEFMGFKIITCVRLKNNYEIVCKL